jgi:hypothetical protein
LSHPALQPTIGFAFEKIQPFTTACSSKKGVPPGPGQFQIRFAREHNLGGGSVICERPFHAK